MSSWTEFKYMLMQCDGRVQAGVRMMVAEGPVAEPSPEGIMKARGVRGNYSIIRRNDSKYSFAKYLRLGCSEHCEVTQKDRSKSNSKIVKTLATSPMTHWMEIE